MSQDRPDVAEILWTVSEFVDALASGGGDTERYDALVASYLLGIVRRELAIGETLAAAEQTRLESFAGRRGTLSELHESLCDAVRAGDCDDRWDDLVALALCDAIDRVKVSKPDYLEVAHRD